MGTEQEAGSAELRRMLDTDQLARPARPLGEGTADRRDPSPTWDPWYSLGIPRRRQLLGFMAPAGTGGISLDDLADRIRAGSLDEALARWAAACELARPATASRDRLDLDQWEQDSARAESDSELYGPAEYAARLGISVPAFHQRRHRGLIPAEDLTLSRVPIWTGETIRIAEEWREVAS